jgi:hypothetical protein
VATFYLAVIRFSCESVAIPKHLYRNISSAPQMKNGSGARSAIPLAPIAAKRWVAIAKTITPVQKMEQKIAAIKDTRKNHFMLASSVPA